MSDITSIPIPKPRKLYFYQQVDQNSIENLTKDILHIEENDNFLRDLSSIYGLTYIPKPIEIYIDSYGGSVYQVLGLIDVITKCTTNIHTIVTGAAMSAGFLMLISGKKRYSYQNSSIMIHQISNFSFGTLEQMKDDVKETKRLNKVLEKLILAKTNITKEDLNRINKEKKDWFINANEALKLRIVDEIL